MIKRKKINNLFFTVTADYNPLFTIFKNRVESEGGTLSAGEITAFNTFFNNEDTTLYDRLIVFGCSNRIASRVSLVNSATAPLANEVGLLDWTANQGYSNPSTAYLDLNYNPAVDGVNYTRNNANRIIYQTNTIPSNSTFVSGVNNTSINTFAFNFSGQVYYGVNSTDYCTVTNTSSLGLWSANRVVSNQVTLHNQGVLFDTQTSNSAAISNLNEVVFGLAITGNVILKSTTSKVAIIGFGSGNINKATQYTNIQALATSLGFAV